MERLDTPVPMNGEILGKRMQMSEYTVRFDLPVLQQIATRTDFPYCESEPIIFCESKWIIRVFPNGFDFGTIGKVEVILMAMSETTVKVEYTLCTVEKRVLIDKTVADLSKTSPETKFSKNAGGYTENLLKGTSQSSSFISSEGRFELQLKLLKTDEHETIYTHETNLSVANNVVPSMFRGHLFHKATSDVDIVVEGTRIPAHKLILSLASPVFTAMFENQMQESASNEIVISDFSEEVVRSMLRCIYDCNAVKSEVEKHADQLLFIANKYELLTELEQSATEHISRNITVDNAIHVLLSADKFDRGQIKSAAMNFIIANLDHFFLLPDFISTLGIELTAELQRYMITNKRVKF